MFCTQLELGDGTGVKTREGEVPAVPRWDHRGGGSVERAGEGRGAPRPGRGLHSEPDPQRSPGTQGGSRMKTGAPTPERTRFYYSEN